MIKLTEVTSKIFLQRDAIPVTYRVTRKMSSQRRSAQNWDKPTELQYKVISA